MHLLIKIAKLKPALISVGFLRGLDDRTENKMQPLIKCKENHPKTVLLLTPTKTILSLNNLESSWPSLRAP